MISVLVLVSALDEESGIRLTLSEIKQYLPESKLIVIDGNSVDKTVNVAKNYGADILFQKGKGKGDAIACGIESIKCNIDYIVFTDADYTYPAKYIPNMIKILNDNPNVGMVCGNRFNSQLDVASMKYFYFGNKLIAHMHNALNGVSLNDPLTGLRAMRWDVLKEWKPISNGFDIEVELNRYIEKKGYDIKEVEITYRERVGKKKLRARHALPIVKRIISEFIIKS